MDFLKNNKKKKEEERIRFTFKQWCSIAPLNKRYHIQTFRFYLVFHARMMSQGLGMRLEKHFRRGWKFYRFHIL